MLDQFKMMAKTRRLLQNVNSTWTKKINSWDQPYHKFQDPRREKLFQTSNAFNTKSHEDQLESE